MWNDIINLVNPDPDSKQEQDNLVQEEIKQVTMDYHLKEIISLEKTIDQLKWDKVLLENKIKHVNMLLNAKSTDNKVSF